MVSSAEDLFGAVPVGAGAMSMGSAIDVLQISHKYVLNSDRDEHALIALRKV